MPPIDANNIGEAFQELTKYPHFAAPSDMVRGKPVPPVEKEPPPECRPVPLPGAPAGEGDAAALWRLVRSRRSRRDFALAPLELRELSTLLWAAQGVLRVDDGHTMRTVPSAGARHPLETYLIINRVESLRSGLYRYRPVAHQLILLREDADVGGKASGACLGQDMVALSAATLVWTAVIDRARWKYQQRAYRYVYLDAGHVCQNLYLACEASGLSCCAIGAFDDDRMNRLIGVDGREEFVIYAAAVGRPKDRG
jgi:SagB-type dehydrogenase family enzyme